MFTSDHSADTRSRRGHETTRGTARPRPRGPVTLRHVDAASGALLVCLGAFVLVQSRQLTFYDEGVPGAGFFPALLAVVLVVLGGALCLRRWWGPVVTAEEFRLPSRHQAQRSLSLWAVVLVGALLVGPAGFPVAMGLLVAAILFGIEGRRGLGAILTTILIPLLSWLIFAQLLQVPLPTGPFGP